MTDDDFRFAAMVGLLACGIFLYLIYERLCAGVVHIKLQELPKPVASEEKSE